MLAKETLPRVKNKSHFSIKSRANTFYIKAGEDHFGTFGVLGVSSNTFTLSPGVSNGAVIGNGFNEGCGSKDIMA